MVFIYVIRCIDLKFFLESIVPDFQYIFDINLCSILYQCFPLSIKVLKKNSIKLYLQAQLRHGRENCPLNDSERRLGIVLL